MWPTRETGEAGKPYPWKHINDYNPDRLPSFSALYIEPTAGGIRWFLQVKGLGVLTIYAQADLDDPTGRCRPTRGGVLTKQELGCCPSL